MSEFPRENPAILYAKTPSTIVAVHLAKAGDEEWKRCDDAVTEAYEAGIRTMIIVADGPGPTSLQRREMKKKSWYGSLNFVVISSSPVIRMICTVGSWLLTNIFTFPPEEIDEAFERLSIPTNERPLILDEIASMRARILGGPNADREAYRLKARS